MKNNYTDITIVLDRSGSMYTVLDETILGFNTFLKDQKDALGSATISLYQFNTTFETIINSENIQEAPDLTRLTFVPAGMTALLDAIGQAINKTGEKISRLEEKERPEKVVFVIITDGLENASHEYTKDQINEMISHQREVYNWEILFLGAGQDAIASAQEIGIVADNAMTYASNAIGTEALFSSTSENLVSYRSGARRSMAYSTGDRELQRKAGA